MAATANVLDLLELLQSRPLTTGAEIAERLAVDRRTVRRYVATLRALGIPAEGERGVGGGYRLRPGFRLPPLMLAEEEAVAVVLGLVAVLRLGLGDPDDATCALAKIRRVLPEPVARRVEGLEAVLGFAGVDGTRAHVSGRTLALVADAIWRRRRLRLAYRSASGERTEREASPHGLVVDAGRWYLAVPRPPPRRAANAPRRPDPRRDAPRERR